MRFYTPAKKCKLDSAWIGPYLIVSVIGWALGIQKDPESPVVIVHCQDIKKVPPPPDCGYLGVGRAGSIPFVSETSGAYGRLLLAVYVRVKAGLLISTDWLRPVTRGPMEGGPSGPTGRTEPSARSGRDQLTRRLAI